MREGTGKFLSLSFLLLLLEQLRDELARRSSSFGGLGDAEEIQQHKITTAAAGMETNISDTAAMERENNNCQCTWLDSGYTRIKSPRNKSPFMMKFFSGDWDNKSEDTHNNEIMSSVVAGGASVY